MDKLIYSKDHINLAKQLKLARIEANLDQKEVAKILNKTQSYISKIESGQRKIDIVQIKIFAEIYKKNVNFFIDKNL